MLGDDEGSRMKTEASRNLMSLPYSEKALQVHRVRNERFLTHLYQRYNRPTTQDNPNNQWKGPVTRKRVLFTDSNFPWPEKIGLKDQRSSVNKNERQGQLL